MIILITISTFSSIHIKTATDNDDGDDDDSDDDVFLHISYLYKLQLADSWLNCIFFSSLFHEFGWQLVM